MTKTNVLGILLESTAKYKDNPRFVSLGKKMFDMYTSGGFPPDMFLDELSKRTDLDLLAKVFITSEYQTHYLSHRRLSGIQEKNLDKIRRKNREDIQHLIETGELGIY